MERDHLSRERNEDMAHTVNTGRYTMPSGEQPGVYGEAWGEGFRLDRNNQCLQGPYHHGY